MVPSPTRETFPGIGETRFNPKHAVTWIEEKRAASQVLYANDIFQELYQSAARPKQSSGHACAKLCGFVEQCSRSSSPTLREYAFAEKTAHDLFKFYVEWNEQDQHRSMRLVLDLLKFSISNNPDHEMAESIKTRILYETIAIITLESTKPSIKSAMTTLDHFLQKNLLYLPEILDIYRQVHRSSTECDITWDVIIDKVFIWMDMPHISPIAGKLLVTIFTLPWYPNQDTKFLPESWHKFLYASLIANNELLEPIKLYIFIPLFKTEKEQSLDYLNQLFSLQTLTKDNNSIDLNSMIWLAALEAGRKTGALAEPGNERQVQPRTDGITHLQETMLEDILCHTSHEARSSAVSILIASPSTTQPYTASSLHLLRKHLPAFHADADGKLRHHVLGHSRHMIARILGAVTTLSRDCERVLKKGKKIKTKGIPGMSSGHVGIPEHDAVVELRTVIQQHEDFVVWYLEFLKHELVSTASYQRHITSLKAMEHVLKSGPLRGVQSGTDHAELKLSLVDITWLRSVLDLNMDPFEDVRETAAALLMLLLSTYATEVESMTVPGLSRPLRDELEEFCERASALASKTSRADHSDGVARSCEVLCHWTTSTEDKLAVARSIFIGLETKLLAAEQDLASAMLEAPIHGSFASLRHIWVAAYSQQELQILESAQNAAIDICNRMWQTVRHVLCDDSPEGHLPEELEEVGGLDTKDLLSYSFRAIHESSNLLRVVASNTRFQDKPSLNTYRTLESIGNLTFDQLANLRHRGAFTTVSQTFTSCCQLVKYCVTPSSEENSLLDEWYQGTLDCVYAQMSTTRRSAGIPALIVGILSSNAEHPSFHAVMHKLQDIAQQSARIAETDGSNLPQVHALNCIKDIFKSSNLSRRAEPYLIDILGLAASSLKSEVWAIRNCGLLLLRSLVDCLFGTNEGKSTMEVGWDGRSTKIAWHKYKALPTLLVNLLEMGQITAESSNKAASAESVFPALDIIRRAGPPEDYKDKLYDNVAWYLGSAIWHVREIAARTLCSFLLRPEWMASIRDLLQQSHASANRLHGTLLTLRYLLERLLDVMPDQLLKHYPVDLLHIVRELPTISGNFGTCPEARAVYFEIITFMNTLGNSKYFSESTREGRFIRPDLNPSLSITTRCASSALLRSKQAQASAGYELLQVESHLNSSEKLNLQVALGDDVNVACDVLEAISSHSTALSDPVTAQLLVGACVPICLKTEAPAPRTLALNILATQLDAILPNESSQTSIHKTPPNEELMTLWASSQEKPLSPGLADAVVRASGPLLVSVMLQNQQPFETSIEQWLRSWGTMMSDAGSVDNGFDTRMASILAIQSFSSHIGLETTPCSHLPWLLALYDALNDDDVEIRDIAATATAPILRKSLVSMEAGSRLLVWLRQHYRHTDEFRTHVICRMIGHAVICDRITDAVLGHWVSAEAQLAAAMQFDDSLFVVEEQNLYIDEVREAQRWRDAFRDLSYPQDDAVLEALVDWTTQGLRTLSGLAEKDDGPLGWTSKPEVFAICSRIVISGAALAEQHLEVRKELRQFVGKGEQTRVHGLLLSMCKLK
ncbi:putative death-receptor fusion protein-domain-containing protein [Xylariales sp. AK1849]|nr:putative death-receptor fusion protein-domain-containing protein [Xylariales sp. AK1849]